MSDNSLELDFDIHEYVTIEDFAEAQTPRLMEAFPGLEPEEYAEIITVTWQACQESEKAKLH